MPTTKGRKSKVFPLRITEAMERQIEDLIAKGFGSAADVMRLAVDRMWRDECARPTQQEVKPKENPE